jgi:rhodanese-related sulfurtransferase
MIRKLTRKQLVELLDSGENVKLVDVLSREHYEKEHIPGAISIPLEKLKGDAVKYLKKNDRIIVYCASFQCQASSRAAELLSSMGFTDASDYEGGIQDYKEDTRLALEGALHRKAVSEYGCCGCS